jgi:hypothetical protein
MQSEFRNQYDEEDIHALTQDARFMIAIDAANLNGGSMVDIIQNYRDGPPYMVRNLAAHTLALLVGDISNRMAAGKIEIPEEWKKRFSRFYETRRVL